MAFDLLEVLHSVFLANVHDLSLLLQKLFIVPCNHFFLGGGLVCGIVDPCKVLDDRQDYLNTQFASSKKFLGNSALSTCCRIEVPNEYNLLTIIKTHVPQYDWLHFISLLFFAHAYSIIGMLHFPVKIIYLNLTWFQIF